MAAGPELPGGTVTFLFTDIEGSTTLLKRLGEQYGDVLREQQRILREATEGREGREVDTQGDSFFFAFARANAALGAAVVAQRALAEHDWPEGAEVRVRMGLHTGEPAVGDERYVGLGVHRAARIGALAHGGQVLLSSATRELVEDEVGGVSVRELGSYRLKDIDRPERLFQLDIEGLQTAFPPLRAEKVTEPRPVRRRSVLLLALAGVVAAAVAVPVFALTGGGSSSAQAFSGVAADSLGVFGSRDGAALAQTKVGTAPSGVATGAGAVWVANTADDNVSRIDLSTNAVVQTISVGRGPAGVAVGGSFVWVANSLDGTVSQIDPQKNGGQEVGRIGIGNGAASIAYGLGAVWVADDTDRTVVRINPLTGKPGQPIPVDAGADAIAVGDGAVWVAAQSAGIVTKLDPRTGSEQPIQVGSGPTAIAVGPDAVWVANSLGDSVSRIDPASNQQRAEIPIGAGAGPSGVAVAGDRVWVSNEDGGTLSRIDPTAGRVVQTVETGNRPADVTLSAGRIYVAVQTSSRAHKGGTLKVDYAGSSCCAADHFDPDITYDTDSWQQLMAVYDGLVAFRRAGGSAGFQIVPDLALSLPAPTDDGRTYTFQLRPGLRYSNGTLVRPADFRRSIERGLANRKGPGPAYYTGIVGAAACLKTPAHCDLSKGIIADSSANTVTFHLIAPDPDFLYKLALPSADAVPANTPLTAHLPLPATGPYMIASYQEGGSVHLVRNPYFHEWSAAAQPNGYPDEIIIDYRSSDPLSSVEQGKADLAHVSGSGSATASVGVRYQSQLHETVSLGNSQIFLNTSVPPFNNLKARRAFSYAINRNHLIQISGGNAQPSCQILPPGVAGYVRYCPYTIHPSPSGKYTGPDLAKARALVAESGTRGQAITYWSPPGKASPQDLYLLSVLRSLGYKARLEHASNSVFDTAYNRPQLKWQLFPPYLGDFADYPAASTFFLPLLTCAAYTPKGNSNFAHFCHPEIDAEMRQATSLQATNPKAATKLWTKIDHTIVDQAPWIAYKTPLFVDLVSRRVGNYIGYPFIGSALLDQLWVR